MSNPGPNIVKKIIEKYIYWALILAESKNKYIGSHFWSLLGGPGLTFGPTLLKKSAILTPIYE